MNKLLIMFSALLTIMSVQNLQARPFHRERIVIPMYGQQIFGRGYIVPLKRLVSDHSRIDVRDAELLSVDVIGNSAAGYGMVELLVNGYYQDRRSLANPQYGLDRAYLQNYGDSNGRWQLRFDGRFRIDRIVAEVRIKNRRGRDGGDYRPEPPRRPGQPNRPPRRPGRGRGR